MTTPKNAAKKVAVNAAKSRATRLTAAEIRRREEAQDARLNIAGFSSIDLAENVRSIALRVHDVFEYELLMAVAARLEEPIAVAPRFAQGGIISGADLLESRIDVIVPRTTAFNSPGADLQIGAS